MEKERKEIEVARGAPANFRGDPTRMEQRPALAISMNKFSHNDVFLSSRAVKIRVVRR